MRIDLKLLKKLRIDSGKKQVDCANALGVRRTAYTKKELGDSPVTIDELNKLLEFIGTDIRAVLTDYVPPAELLDFVLIPKYGPTLSADNFAAESKDVQKSKTSFAFRKAWIKHRGNPENFISFTVSGDSMSPAINNEDVVLIDRTANDLERITNGKIYAFSERTTIKIKRLAWQGDNLLVVSENKDIDPDYSVSPEKINLIGQVVWVGHNIT